MSREPQSDFGIAFECAGLELQHRKDDEWQWKDARSPAVIVLGRVSTPPNWQADVRDMERLRRQFRCRTLWGGYTVGLIECEVLSIQGCECLRMFRKDPLNFYPRYSGWLVFTFEDMHCSVCVYCDESGIYDARPKTYRDYVVFQRAIESGEVSLTTINRVQRAQGWYRDLYDPTLNDTTLVPFGVGDTNDIVWKKITALRSLADDEKHDAAFPESALSRVRRVLGAIEKSLVVDAELRRNASFRLPARTSPSLSRDRPADSFRKVKSSRSQETLGMAILVGGLLLSAGWIFSAGWERQSIISLVFALILFVMSAPFIYVLIIGIRDSIFPFQREFVADREGIRWGRCDRLQEQITIPYADLSRIVYYRVEQNLFVHAKGDRRLLVPLDEVIAAEEIEDFLRFMRTHFPHVAAEGR